MSEEVAEMPETEEYIEEVEGGAPEEAPAEEAPDVDMEKYHALELDNTKLKSDSENLHVLMGVFDKARSGDAAARTEIENWIGQPIAEEPQVDPIETIASEYGDDLAQKIEGLIEHRVSARLKDSGLDELKQANAARTTNEHNSSIISALTALEKVSPGISKAYEDKDFKTMVSNLGGLNLADPYQVKAFRLKAAYNTYKELKKPAAAASKQAIEQAKNAETLRSESRPNTSLKEIPKFKKASDTYHYLIKAGKFKK